MSFFRNAIANKIPDRSNLKSNIYFPYVSSISGSGGGSSSPGIDEYTKLILHMDGTNGSTTFTDSSITPKTVTANGNASISTATGKFGQSGYFDGTGDYLSTSDSDDWAFGTGDLTIDFWVNFSSLPTDGAEVTLFSQYATDNSLQFIKIRNLSSVYYLQYFHFNGVNSLNINNAITISTGTWYHIALVRNSNTWRTYKDGVQFGSDTASSVAVPNIGAELQIGIYNTTLNAFHGYLDEYRISKGIARYTGNFTPSSVPYST